MDVVTLHWPAEDRRREELRRVGQPRLLLVDPQAPPPVADDPLEDWARLPVGELDVRARVDGLLGRAAAQLGDEPELDEHGVLRYAGRWVSIPPVEARLTHSLLGRFGKVVSRQALADAGWPDGMPGRNVLDVHVLRLRRRLEPVRLVIRTVRSRGYLLEPETLGSHNGAERVTASTRMGNHGSLRSARRQIPDVRP